MAPAKINLALHVTGRRNDGYHLIDSAVVFARFGDVVSVASDETDRFSISGPEAAALSADPDSGNLVTRARDALRRAATAQGLRAGPVRIMLDKRLPVASGIGGGSADAAATLTALMDVWGYRPDDHTLGQIALELGADVPMCLSGRPLIARGIGEILTPLDLVVELDLVIVNPRIGVSTPAVFAALDNRSNAPLPPPRHFDSRAGLTEWLAHTRNDLERPARAMVPAIGACLDALSSAGAELVRMSGSGASCFGLFDSSEAARKAASDLREAHPDWFVTATSTGPV